MGGGDLNMKKSWHPVRLVNQERVWQAQRLANGESAKLTQLQKEREEERELAEMQSWQEASTGRKRVEKLDWMYAVPGTVGSALGGARISDSDQEAFLLGKRRIDEALVAGDKNGSLTGIRRLETVGNLHKEFIAVQNANSARDTAVKIREDPLLAIKRQELAAIEALKNRPDVQRKLKEMQKAPERRTRKKAEKEDHRKARHHRRHRYRDSRRSRSSSLSRDRGQSHRRSRSGTPRRVESGARRLHDRTDLMFHPRHYTDGARASDRNTDGLDETQPWLPARSRLDAMHLAHRRFIFSPPQPSFGSSTSIPPTPHAHTQTLNEQRSARLAAMSANAHAMDIQRSKSVARRVMDDQREKENDEEMRQQYGKEAVMGMLFAQKSEMGLSDMIGRRAGQGLQRDI